MKAIFLDRDGVINKYPGDKKYVTSLRKFRFLPNAKRAICKLHKYGFRLFVVSNQAGVGRKIYSQSTLDAITKRMLEEIENEGGKIEVVYYCIHPKEENCACRKPKTGLIEKAKKKYPINIRGSFFIGDTIRDVKTAKAAGCKSVLVLSGREKILNRKTWEEKPDFIFKDLLEAAKFIIRKK